MEANTDPMFGHYSGPLYTIDRDELDKIMNSSSIPDNIPIITIPDDISEANSPEMDSSEMDLPEIHSPEIDLSEMDSLEMDPPAFLFNIDPSKTDPPKTDLPKIDSGSETESGSDSEMNPPIKIPPIKIPPIKIPPIQIPPIKKPPIKKWPPVPLGRPPARKRVVRERPVRIQPYAKNPPIIPINRPPVERPPVEGSSVISIEKSVVIPFIPIETPIKTLIKLAAPSSKMRIMKAEKRSNMIPMTNAAKILEEEAKNLKFMCNPSLDTDSKKVLFVDFQNKFMTKHMLNNSSYDEIGSYLGFLHRLKTLLDLESQPEPVLKHSTAKDQMIELSYRHNTLHFTTLTNVVINGVSIEYSQYQIYDGSSCIYVKHKSEDVVLNLTHGRYFVGEIAKMAVDNYNLLYPSINCIPEELAGLGHSIKCILTNSTVKRYNPDIDAGFIEGILQSDGSTYLKLINGDSIVLSDINIIPILSPVSFNVIENTNVITITGINYSLREYDDKTASPNVIVLKNKYRELNVSLSIRLAYLNDRKVFLKTILYK